MFYDLGNLSFDEEQRRYVYEENWGGDGDPLLAWMIEALSDPYDLTLPELVAQVRYAERKLDLRGVEYKLEQVVVLGLSGSVGSDHTQAPDRLNQEEIELEITDDSIDVEITITLVEDLAQSMKLLSSLRLFAEERQSLKAA